MATKTSCDTCATEIDGSDKVICETCATSCTGCERTSSNLLCSDCAEEEYGADDREPDDDDVVAYIEDAGITDDIGDLAAAIRRGNLHDAEYLLDKIAAAIPGWSDRISISRYSPRAKAA